MSSSNPTSPGTPLEAWRSAVWSSALRPKEKVTALAFAEHADGGGTTCVSLARVAEQTSLANSSVQTAVKALRDHGWLLVVSPYLATRPTVYRLTTPRSAELPVGVR